jgi:hypothetical protein
MKERSWSYGAPVNRRVCESTSGEGRALETTSFQFTAVKVAVINERVIENAGEKLALHKMT